MLLSCLAPFSVVPAAADPPVALEVVSRALTGFAPGVGLGGRIGRLEFRGGLELSSPFAGFGGMSGLRFDETGTRLLAVTDKGLWLRGRLETEGDRPLGLVEMVAAPILGTDGRPLARQGRGDVEALTRTPDGWAIGIERRQEIWRFTGPDPLTVRGRPVATGRMLEGLGYNAGIEGLAAAMLGTPPRSGLVAVAEKSPMLPNELPGFLFGAGRPGRFVLARSGDFAATDLALGPADMLYLLERRYSPWQGVALRIRRFPLAAVQGAAPIVGETLIEIGMSAQIDNMEGLAVHANAAGETILTLISDNNFSAIQRNLLLRFAVVD
ncbi:MAG TPA: esterase-like activity of phytase family protein [Xanthobacteraceae bacterium]|nr:esterase-like activity of phytase family protein [Xanthobacteraceae bacterium]